MKMSTGSKIAVGLIAVSTIFNACQRQQPKEEQKVIFPHVKMVPMPPSERNGVERDLAGLEKPVVVYLQTDTVGAKKAEKNLPKTNTSPMTSEFSLWKDKQVTRLNSVKKMLAKYDTIVASGDRLFATKPSLDSVEQQWKDIDSIDALANETKREAFVLLNETKSEVKEKFGAQYPLMKKLEQLGRWMNDEKITCSSLDALIRSCQKEFKELTEN